MAHCVERGRGEAPCEGKVARSRASLVSLALGVVVYIYVIGKARRVAPPQNL
jgi:hypothetical protein